MTLMLYLLTASLFIQANAFINPAKSSKIHLNKCNSLFRHNLSREIALKTLIVRNMQASLDVSFENRNNMKIEGKFGSMVKVLRRLSFSVVGVMLALFVSGKKNAIAAVESVRGWDLYGRLPHDDWLFSTFLLTNPKILRSSFSESLANELPIALYAYRRKKRLSELFSALGTVGTFAAGVLLVGFLYKSANAANQRKAIFREMGDVTAINKKSKQKGHDIDNMGDGWVDMDDEDED